MSEPLILIPCLHRQLAEPGLRAFENAGPVAALWPGLPDMLDLAAGEVWHLPSYPYSAAEAKACLNDWRALVADKSGAARALPDDARLRAVLGRPHHAHEERDLARFASTGVHDGLPEDFSESTHGLSLESGKGALSPALPDAARLREAQRRLIMVWMQEEEVLSIRNALDAYRQGLAHLTSSLGDGETAGLHELEALAAFDESLAASEHAEPAATSALTHMEALLSDDTASLLPSWTFVLDAMAPFLPEGAVLCTTDARLAMALREWNPEAARPAPCVSVYQVPLWRLAGRRVPSTTAPWLNRTHEVRVVEA